MASTVGDLVGGHHGTVGTFLVNGKTAIPATTPVFDTMNFTAPFDAGGGIPENQYDLVGRLD